VEDEVWVELDWDAGKQLLAEFIDHYQFRMGIESKDWPAIVEPIPSVTWDMTQSSPAIIPEVAVTRHHHWFTHVHPFGLPLTCDTRSERAPSGFPLGFAPGHY
jgi:Protein of unknown function (DUF2716)